MNGPPYSALAVPEPLDEDDDDIRWALHTAAVQWRRGAREDAVAWVRRGADAAVDGGFWERASQLNMSAAQLDQALKAQTSAESPIASSPPRATSRAPLPVPQPVSSQPSRASLTASPQTVRPAPLSKPPSVRVPTSPASGSRWPSGFPKGTATATPSGHAIAPPPPLPASVRVHKAPIPPPPKSHSKSREMDHDAVEIEIGEETVDLSEAERMALREDSSVPSHFEYTEPSLSAIPSSPMAGAEFSSLPSYDLDEDPSDGTTALPIIAPYISSLPPDSMDGQSLPAFPLDDSSPAGPPTFPPEAPTSFRQKPPPQFTSVKPADPPGSRGSPTTSSQRPLGTRNLARWASRDEPQEIVRRMPSQTSPRQPSLGASQTEKLDRVSQRVHTGSPEAASKPSKSPPIRVPQPQFEEDDGLLEPVALAAHDEAGSDAALQDEEREATKLSRPDGLTSEAEGSLVEEAVSPPSTARGLGQLGSRPPEALLSEDLQASAVTEAPPAPARSVAAPATFDSEFPTLSLSSESPPMLTMSELPPTRTPLEASPPPIPSELPPASFPSESPPAPTSAEVPSAPTSADGLEGPISSAVPSIHGVVLAEVRGLCDLPEDAQRLLRQRARIERMGTGEDLSFFAVVLVLEGWVKLMPAIADITCAMASAGDVVFTQGSLEDGVALRVTAGQNGTTLATWDKATFNEITEACPWVADELRLIADSFQALAGTTLGLLGERLDDALREVVTSKCQVLTLLPHEVLVSAGKPVPGMHIVGAGTVELLDASGTLVATCAPGDFLLTDQVLAGGMSPHTARAASGGALVLFAPRMVAHELLVSVPPLLEILAG